MKRYLVFAYTDYYPAGGWSDFVSDHKVFEDAKAAAVAANEAYAEIVDTKDRLVYAQSSDFRRAVPA